MRRIAVMVGVVVVVASVGGGGAAVWAHAEKHARPAGVNFGIHTYADPNFCLESEGDGSLIVSECAARDNQHFTFTDNSDGTNQIIDGYGECLDRGSGTAGTPLRTKQCNFGATQHFRYRSTGRLDDPAGTVCVAATTAAQGAAVFDDGCHAKSVLEIFQLSH
jgi:hypothetical protein